VIFHKVCYYCFILFFQDKTVYLLEDNLLCPMTLSSIPSLERHQYLAKLIFFCSYMLLWFYVYSVNSFAFFTIFCNQSATESCSLQAKRILLHHLLHSCFIGTIFLYKYIYVFPCAIESFLYTPSSKE